MFESAEVGCSVDKKEYGKCVATLRTRILKAQHRLAETDLRLVILVGGVEGGGKTEVARRFLDWLDPRGLRVEAYGEPSDEEDERPEYWRYWRTLPAAGSGAVLVGSWYTRPIVRRTFKEIGAGDFDQALDRAIAFESMLVREKTVLVKLWLHLSEKEQKRRFKELESDRDTAWRVTKQDWDFSRKYDRFREVCERALSKTSVAGAAWSVIEATDRRYRDLTAGEAVLAALEAALVRASAPGSKHVPDRAKPPKISVLSRLDLTKRLEGDYSKKFDKQQT
ncbi:MAG: polyphosphate kinase 2, partial [Elusimicrobia bacterium CG11_big_fil_rev_8_21_14_0_20_64_6]